MRVKKLGCHTNVSVSAREVEEFKASWPCSGLPDKAFTFQFDNKNGDLVDFWPSKYDGEALAALSRDAQKFAGL